MTAAIGYSAVIVALASSIAIVVGSMRRRSGLPAPWLRWAMIGLVTGSLTAMVALQFALISHDFSIAYVADNHARSTPLLFTIASAWAALEGSLVLWGLVLAGYTWWVWTKADRGNPMSLGALAVMGAVASFFFGLLATASNPFAASAITPLDGVGPNPLLENNILMAVHPPLLYMGLVGLTVPFAFAIAALVDGTSGSAWLERTRNTTLVAWGFLTAGITLGALWSYAVLGWGGYWAWDPVENASFLPWLTATAFIHSSIVQRRRGMLAAWNMTLVITTFALTIFGTFLTRSGVIASVHSFTQSAVGPALLVFFTVVTLGSFALLVTRLHVVAGAPRLESLASREGVFLANNLLLTLFAFAVLMGTTYPLLVEAFSSDQVSVGRPFFDRAAVPLSLVLLVAMGLGPVTPYRVATATVTWERLRSPVRIAVAAGLATALLATRHWGAVLVVVLATFVVSSMVRHLWWLARRAAAGSERSVPAAAWRLMRRDSGYWGGQIAHFGVALVAVALTMSTVFAEKAEVSLELGETASFGGYELTYEAPFSRNEANRTVVGAELSLSRHGERLVTLRPSINTYTGRRQSVPSPALRVGLTEDFYVSLTRIDGGGISADLFRNPLMWMLWVGGFVIVGGAAWPLTVGRKEREADAEELVRA
ncbi:MAG: cytochrome c-type biogenesis CcmF C-terminal domain-containing protein [Acidimicrobiia bacterium]